MIRRVRCSPNCGHIAAQQRTHAPQHGGSLDHLVCEREQGGQDGQAQRGRSLEVDHQIEHRRGLDRQLARVGAPENAIEIGRRKPVTFDFSSDHVVGEREQHLEFRDCGPLPCCVSLDGPESRRDATPAPARLPNEDALLLRHPSFSVHSYEDAPNPS